jgi:hypothetical protein
MGNNSNRWTPEELQVARSLTLREALLALPHRTQEAIRSVRKGRVLCPQFRPWTKAELARIKRYAREPLVKLANRFPGRTVAAVKAQRSNFIGSRQTGKRAAHWKNTEVTTLRKMWPAAPWPEILAALPGRTYRSIRGQSVRLGLKRPHRLSTPTDDLRGAVRVRAQQDGINLKRMGTQTGCGSHYFITHKVKTIDYNKIARAVHWFGGRLVIDWQDE